VRRNPQLDRDFLGRKMGIDKAKTVELTGRQFCHPIDYQVLTIHRIIPDRGIRHRELLSTPFCLGSPAESAAIYVKTEDSTKYLLT
jgi:hypothetical protein